MSAPVRNPYSTCEPLHLFSVTSDALLTLIQEEYGAWEQPCFQFSCFTDLAKGMDILLVGRCPVIDLAIIELPSTARSGVECFLGALRRRFPECPAIVSYPEDAPNPERLLFRGLVEIVEAPADIPELVAATCELARAGRGSLSTPRNRVAIRARAIALLQDQLLRLRGERSRVTEAINAIARRPPGIERAQLSRCVGGR